MRLLLTEVRQLLKVSSERARVLAASLRLMSSLDEGEALVSEAQILQIED